MNTKQNGVFSQIEQVIEQLTPEIISEERKKVLQPLADFIQSKVGDAEAIRLNFICTHNSRRSHLAQTWAQVFAHYFNLQKVFSYSAGTETTAVYSMIIETLQRTGFEITSLSKGENPVYAVKYAPNGHPVIAFSKTLDSAFNPHAGFVAIMTCSQADGNCPFITGAEQRIPITFEDPKVFDNTPQQKEKYYERSIQIATEMFYVFSHIKS